MSSSHGISRVPCEPVTRLLRAYVAERTDQETGEREVLKLLALKVGQDPDNFRRRIFQGRNDTVDLYLADRILCAIDAVDAWHTDPELSRLYNLCLAA